MNIDFFLLVPDLLCSFWNTVDRDDELKECGTRGNVGDPGTKVFPQWLCVYISISADLAKLLVSMVTILEYLLLNQSEKSMGLRVHWEVHVDVVMLLLHICEIKAIV